MVKSVIFLLALGLAASAQSPELVLHSSSRLVEISVVAHDKQGRSVQDLARNDFVVFDGDKQRNIAVFALQIAEPDAAPAQGVPERGQITLTNRNLRQTEHPSAATVILFDSLNTRGLDTLLYAQRELLKFLQTLHPGDPVALYLLAGPQVRVIHDFTDDMNSLVDAARRSSGKMSTRGPGAYTGFGLGQVGAMGDFLGASRLDQRALDARMRLEDSLNAIESIANHLEGIPGRKNLVWISAGVPLTSGLNIESFVAAESFGTDHELKNNSARMKRLTGILNRADVAVYPIDPRGLMTDFASPEDSSDRPQTLPRWQINGHPNIALAEVAVAQPVSAYPFFETVSARNSPRWASMDLFADQTGGRAFYNANDIGGSIRRAMDDAKVTYVLGFYPEEADWDGKYHKLYVRVRRSGVELRARRGYWAAGARDETEPQREQSLQLAAASPLEATAVGVTLNAQSNPLPEGLNEVVIKVEPRDLHFSESGGRWSADLDMLFVQLTQDGRSLGGEKDTVQCRFKPETYARAMEQGIFLPRQVFLKPGGSRLRVVVRDATTGAVGSVSVPTCKPKPETERRRSG